MIKAKPWDGANLYGTWQFTLKVDGVRALRTPAGWISRSGKPLYNLPDAGTGTDCEVYCGGYKQTIERVMARTKNRPISEQELYSLDPLDPRLDLCRRIDPTADFILAQLEQAISTGHEGLVLRCGIVWLKVKPDETHDVPVIGRVEGTGKHQGRLGALITPMGKVGTGFTDEEREQFWKELPSLIEVSCMQLTPGGKFRHPRFIRVREDK